MLKANLKIVLSRNWSNFVKNYFFVCKNSYAHLQYIYNKYAWFKNDQLKNVRGVDYTNSIPYNAKSCLKWLRSKGCNSVKTNSSSPKTHMLIFNMSTTGRQGFKKIHLKLWEELITQTLYRNAWQTDGQTEGQTGANLNAPLTIVTGGINFFFFFLFGGGGG